MASSAAEQAGRYPSRISDRLAGILRYRHLALVLLLAANLAAGLLVFQDYGLAWDEPLFYRYADAIGYAYSIEARLDGSFDIEKSYGPSADHAAYGPAYLLLAKPVVNVLGTVLPARQSDLWHLVNFLTFQIAIISLYALTYQITGRWAAFSAALLFATQPVLWGFAWINPKDMPFLVFFLLTMTAGLRMGDRLVKASSAEGKLSDDKLSYEAVDVLSVPNLAAVRLGKLRPVLLYGSTFILLVTLAVLVLAGPLQRQLADLIEAVYRAPAGSAAGRLFSAIAPHAGQVPLEDYLHKGSVLFWRARLALGLLALVLLPLSIILFFKPAALERTLTRLAEILAPLPSLPNLWLKGRGGWAVLKAILPGAVLLGLLSAIRILGPLAGLLVVVYFFLRYERRSLADVALYALLAFSVMYMAWPYLWEAPLTRFWEVSRHMSNNPQILSVVFNGAEHSSNNLPAFYLPKLLGLTLTEPVWPLFMLGMAAAGLGAARRTVDWRRVLAILLWFLVPLAYVVLLRPPMYDGYRHFLFMLPPVFVMAGVAFQWIRDRMKPAYSNLLLLALVVPGLLGIARMHPYQYTYFNSFTGGISGAFRQFETDFWLTCYREIIEQVNQDFQEPVTLFVHRQPAIAREYASSNIDVRPYDQDDDQTFPGSLLLLSSRTGVDYKYRPDDPVVYQVGRGQAVFCLIRQVR